MEWDEQGKPARLVGTHADITERKQTEELLRRQHEMLARAERIAHLGSWEWEIKTDQVRWSEELFRIFQRDPARGAPSYAEHPQLYVAEDMVRLREVVDACVSRGTPYELELRAIRADGTLRHCIARGQSAYDSVERIVRLVGSFQDITERKEAETALREAEQRHRIDKEFVENLLDVSEDSIFVFEPATGNAIRWNNAFRKITGYTDEEIAALKAPDAYYSPAELARAGRAIESVFAEGRATIELTLLTKDGKAIPFEYRASVLPDPAGEPRRCIAIGRDITERKQAETALRESREEYRSLFQSVQVGLVVHAPDTRILFSNPMASQLLGLTPDQMRGKTAIDDAWRFIREDGTPLPLAEYPVNQALATRQPFTNLTLGILRPDREGPIWVQCNAHQDRGIDGQPQRVVVMFADITAHKQSEEALRQSHAMLDTILNAIPQSVFWKDRDCRYLGCNARFAEAVGLQSPHEIVGKTDFDLPWPRKEAEAYRADDRQVMAYNSPKTHIVEPLQQADGSRIWIDTTKIPLRDGQGGVHGILGVYEDITTRKQVEERLRDSEERFKRVSLVISDFAYSCRKRAGQEYQIDWLTGAIERISGYSADEILAARCWRFLVLAEDQPLFAQGVTSLMPGESATRELRIRHKDGTVRWLQSSAQCLTDSDDPADHLIYGGCLVITERKRAEEEQRKTEHRLKEAERLAHLGSWELDLVTRELTWSDEIYRLFEIDPAQCGASYEAFLNAIHPDDRDAVEQAYSSSLQTHTDYDIDHRLLMPDGRVKYVHEHGITVYDATGRALRSVGTMQDITERQRIETELQHKLSELQQWYEVMLGREDRVLELKREVDSLRQRLGEPPRYAMELTDDLSAEPVGMRAAEAGATTPPTADPLP